MKNGVDRFRLGGGAVLGGESGECLRVRRIVVHGVLAVDGEPTGDGEDFAFGFKFVLGRDGADARGDVEFSRREKRGDEAAGDHVEDLGLHVIEVLGLVRGGDDGEVIGDLRVVEDALVGAKPTGCEHLAGVGAQGAGEIVERLATGGNVILRQRARVGAGVGDHLVALVEGLRDLQGAARGETVAVVRLALERGEIVEARCGLTAAFFLFGDGHGRRARPLAAYARGEDGFAEGLFPDAIDAIMIVAFGFLKMRALVNAFVATLRNFECGGHAPVVAGLEISDFQLADVEDGEGGGLDTADGGDVAGAGAEHPLGERAGAVDSDEPVALAAATRGVGEAGHLLAIAKLLEGFLNTARGHRLHPRAFHGELRFRELVEIGEDQLALASGVAGIDDGADVFAGEEFFQRVEAIFGVLDGLEAKFFGNDGQRLQPPEAVFLLVDVLRHFEFHEVAECVRDDKFVVFVMVACLGNFPEGAREVGRNGRFLGDDE